MSSADSDRERDRLGIDAAPKSQTLDALATVRRHPEWYFRGGLFDGDEAVGVLVAEALRGGAKNVSVRREQGAVVLTADADWLGGDLAAFLAPQTYPEGGQNSSRIEVALVAFCRAVVTLTPSDPLRFWSQLGDELVGEDLESWRPGAGRLVAFWPPDVSSEPTRSAPEGTATRRLRLVPTEGETAITSAVDSFVQKEPTLR